MLESNPFPRAALGSPMTTGTLSLSKDAAATASAAKQTNPDQLVKGATMARLTALSFHPVITTLRLALAELADLAGQLVEVGQGTVTFHFNRATLDNVADQLRDALGL